MGLGSTFSVAIHLEHHPVTNKLMLTGAEKHWEVPGPVAVGWDALDQAAAVQP